MSSVRQHACFTTRTTYHAPRISSRSSARIPNARSSRTLFSGALNHWLAPDGWGSGTMMPSIPLEPFADQVGHRSGFFVPQEPPDRQPADGDDHPRLNQRQLGLQPRRAQRLLDPRRARDPRGRPGAGRGSQRVIATIACVARNSASSKPACASQRNSRLPAGPENGRCVTSASCRPGAWPTVMKIAPAFSVEIGVDPMK